jgi:hypothetical protein
MAHAHRCPAAVGGIGRASLVLAVALVAPACGDRSRPPPPGPRDARAVESVVAPVEIPAAPLGLADPAGYRWRERGGQAAFQGARAAEQRGDWPAVVAACEQALAADPSHLEAAWLLAVGRARRGQLDRVLEPLQRAAAGDFARWGVASLELPALQAFLATPTGAAWRRRVDQDRARYFAAIARAVIVTADRDLHAFVPGAAREAGERAEPVEAGRWLRLTRTRGGLIAALAIPGGQIAYITRAGRRRGRELGLGVVDLGRLGRGGSSAAVALGTRGPITVAYSARPPAGFRVGIGARPLVWRRLDDERRLQPLPPRTPRPEGPRLEITAGGAVRLRALPPSVTADWDDQSLASAIRIATSNRVVSVPSPGLIDGNTVVWSPDRVHLAFVAQLDDHCTEGAVNTAAFVADAATGGTREIERAAGGIALQWLAERKLAIAGDGGVAIYSLDDGARTLIAGASGLLVPRERPRCGPAPAAPAPDVPAESEEPEELAGDEPVDAGVVDAR